ncbi:MAG: hypothetical protein LUQ54_03910 [Methanoregula sp.]|nr:hypothetical protein [Methanoregula sp.]
MSSIQIPAVLQLTMFRPGSALLILSPAMTTQNFSEHLLQGETGKATFEISLNKSATIKEYALDSEAGIVMPWIIH